MGSMEGIEKSLDGKKRSVEGENFSRFKGFFVCRGGNRRKKTLIIK